MAQKIKGTLRERVLEHIFRLGPGQVNEKRSGEVTSLMLDGVEALEPFYVNYVPQVVTVILTGAFSFIYLSGFDIEGAVILILAMLLCAVVPFFTVPLVEGSINDYWTDYSALTSQYIDAIQGITTLKTLNAEKKMGSDLEKDATAFWHRSIRNTGSSLRSSALILVLTATTSSLTVLIVALRAYSGDVPVEAVSAFLFLTAECARPLFDLDRFWHASFLGLSTAKGLFSLLDTDPAVTERPDPVTERPGGMPEIEFDHVTFSYTGNEDVLHDVSFRIPSGSKTAIVGRSGSGKSTIVNLLLRFYDPGSGSIRLSGIDLRDYSFSCMMSGTAAVFQDSFLFYGTVTDNIRAGRPDASDEEVRSAAALANAAEFIEKLPEGYDTLIGERGLTLSGGERQRISIARAILKDAPLLILDEATASVDAESERLIQEAIDDLTVKRTTVMVAHRLSTVRDADNIIVLEDGRVAEQGTHDELIRAGGLYYSLVKAQEEIRNV